MKYSLLTDEYGCALLIQKEGQSYYTFPMSKSDVAKLLDDLTVAHHKLSGEK